MTNHFLLTTLAAASTLLAGCSLIPAYERPAAPVAPHYAGAADAAAAKPSETATAVALQWSRYFTDAQLQELIGIALANNRDLRVAALNLDKAQAQFQIQRSALAPQLAAQGNATRGNNQSTGELGNTFIAGVTVPAWELDFFGRIRSLKSAALAQYFATDEARQAYELALVASVAQGWLTLLADEELLELSSRTLATRQESMRLTQLRFDTGISSELDLRQAQSLVEAARVTTAQQKRQRAEHENALVLLLGQELPASARSALQTTRLATIAPMADIPAGLPSDLLTHRPDIRQAEQQLLSANANIGAARAALFPRISLTTSFGTASADLSGLFKGGSDVWTFAPQIVTPIFDPRLWYAYDVTKIEKEISIAQYEKSIQTAFREVADALAEKGTVSRRVTAQQSLVDAMAVVYRLSEMRYEKGIDSYLSVLDAQRSLYGAQQGLILLRLASVNNIVTLYKTLGGGASS